MKASSLFFLGFMALGIPLLIALSIDTVSNEEWKWEFGWKQAIFLVAGIAFSRITTWYIDKRYILINRIVRVGDEFS